MNAPSPADGGRPAAQRPGPTVALFVTCLVDLMRPSVGFAAVKLLKEAGCRVIVPSIQTCCGQPSYNSGDRDGARALARQTIDALSPYEYVVVPSGSCAGMISRHYPALFADQPEMRARAEALAARSFELTAFLHDVLKVSTVPGRHQGTVTYHDSCSGLRELGVKDQPRRLLGAIPGLRLVELRDPETCCGFGGTFCVKYPDISNAMVGDKMADIEATGAATLLAGDLGCLMNMAGKLRREGRQVRVFHVAEVLAGMDDRPAIGEG